MKLWQSFVSVLVMGAGAEFCLAQTSSTDPLPAALQKGINISDVYGNYNWQMLYDPDGVGGFQIGDNPYPPSRITDALNKQDFKELASRGFTHVRIPIDPWALGMFESPGFGLPPNYQVSSIGRQVLDALVDDIEAAWDYGVWTIVDFHPVVNARGYWNNFYNQRFGPPFLSATDPAPNDYPGVYKWHFFQKGTATTPSPLTQAWNSIMVSLEEVEHPIVLEILNEPLDSAWEHDNNTNIWGLDGAGAIGGVPPLPFNNTQPDTWISQARANWKDITVETVRAIEGKERYIVVSPPTEIADDFQPNSVPPFHAYNTAHCQYPENLIYTCHFHIPGNFTQHLGNYASYWYQKSRDYFPPTFTSYPDTPMEQKLGFVQQWYNQNRGVLGGMHLPLHLMYTEFGAIRDNRTRIGGPSTEQVPTDPGSGNGYPSSLNMYSAKWIYDARKGIEANPEFGWTYFNVLGGFGAYDGSLNNAGWGNHGNWLGLNVEVRDALFAP